MHMTQFSVGHDIQGMSGSSSSQIDVRIGHKRLSGSASQISSWFQTLPVVENQHTFSTFGRPVPGLRRQRSLSPTQLRMRSGIPPIELKKDRKLENQCRLSAAAVQQFDIGAPDEPFPLQSRSFAAVGQQSCSVASPHIYEKRSQEGSARDHLPNYGQPALGGPNRSTGCHIVT